MTRCHNNDYFSRQLESQFTAPIELVLIISPFGRFWRKPLGFLKQQEVGGGGAESFIEKLNHLYWRGSLDYWPPFNCATFLACEKTTERKHWIILY